MTVYARLQSMLRQRSGHVMVSAIIASSVVAGMGVVMVNRATAHVRQMQLSAEADQSWYLAMAGIEDCMARLRWDGKSWLDLVLDKKVSSITCTGSLAGGTFTAVATQPSGTSTVARIESTGSYQRFTKKLGAVVQWVNKDANGDGSSSLYGGGNWRFGGNANIEGNIASTGSIVLGGGATVCGNVYAGGTISVEGSSKINCGQPYEKTTLVVEYYDPISTWTRVYPGDLTCPSDDCDMNFPSVKVNGILSIDPKGKYGSTYEFPQDTVVMANGYRIYSDMRAAPGKTVKLYSMSNWGSTAAEPCPASKGTPAAGDVGSVLTAWVANKTIRDVFFWIPNGKIFFQGSQAGEAGVYGRIYANCVETSDNWNFFPGSDVPEKKPGSIPDPSSALEIISLFDL